jgi:peptidoglycan/xylan/chitin deacetylase (PgdA/CDA1 family)
MNVGAAVALMVLIFLALVLLVLCIVYHPPHFIIRLCKRRWPNVIWDIKTDQRVVALTVDDGPTEYTRAIARILKENDCHATFFIIGSHVTGREDTLGGLVRDGHELANHAMRDEASRGLPVNVLESQMYEVEALIQNTYRAAKVERAPKYFRPGSGFFSTAMLRMVQKMGYQLVLGSIYPHDPQIPFWRVNSWHVLSLLRPGAVIICHDGREWTIPMLCKVLPEIRKRGCRVVTVTELLKYSKT